MEKNLNMHVLSILLITITPLRALCKEIKFYVADEVSHSENTIGVDACDMQAYSEKEEEKVDSPPERPSQLFLLTDSVAHPLKYENVKRKTYVVCDSKLPRNIWVWKSKVPIKSIPLLSDSQDVRFKLFEADFRIYKLTPNDISRMSATEKRWSTKDYFKLCSAFKWQTYLRIDCQYSSYIFKDHKLLHEISDPDKGVFLNLIGSATIQNEEYYFLAFYNEPSRPLKDSYPYVLKTATGKTIYPEDCSLPSGC